MSANTSSRSVRDNMTENSAEPSRVSFFFVFSLFSFLLWQSRFKALWKKKWARINKKIVKKKSPEGDLAVLD